jgi:HEAT repeat protein
MKNPDYLLRLVFLCAAILPVYQSQAAENAEEQTQIQILKANSSPAEKDAACARLKRIGTQQSVPALAALLADEQLSHSARYALESMPYAEAGRALVEALDKSQGATQVGIINSIGFRRESSALPVLAKILADAEAKASSQANSGSALVTARAAAAAMGQIGGAKALSQLQAAAKDSKGQFHETAIDGILRCANGLANSGERVVAMEAYSAVYQGEQLERFRVAAYRGLIQAAGQNAAQMVVQGILSSDASAQIAALQLVREVDSPGATEKFTALLPNLAPPIQAALIGNLAQRNDPAAAPAIAALVNSPEVQVRLSALNALASLGDASTVPLLVRTAASAKGEEQTAARFALARIRRGDVTGSLLSLLSQDSPEIQAESARALGERGDPAAVSKLVGLAQSGSDSVRKASLQALALLAGKSDIRQLVTLVTGANQEAARTQSAEALNAACQRLQSRYGRIDVQPIVDGLSSGSVESKAALLSCCSGLVDPKIRTALKAALAESDPKVRSAAVHALCDTSDAELLPELQKVACSAPEESLRNLAIGGCVRLATQEEGVKLPNAAKLEIFKAILATPLRTEQKRKVLGGLAEVPELESLRLAEGFIDDASVRSEAVRAVIKLAPALPNPDEEAAMTALKKAVSAASDDDARTAARNALNHLEANAAYLTSWQVAGPFSQDGKDFSSLFDIEFPPEQSGTKSVKWQPLSPGSDPARPWLMDLLKALGGEQRVAYARTWIYSGQDQSALLELGSDDGVKVWLNQKLVHSNNTARPLQPGSDHAYVSLKQGWNQLMLKITQNNLGWEFCARLVKQDGTYLDGLRCEANREAGAGSQH